MADKVKAAKTAWKAFKEVNPKVTNEVTDSVMKLDGFDNVAKELGEDKELLARRIVQKSKETGKPVRALFNKIKYGLERDTDGSDLSDMQGDYFDVGTELLKRNNPKAKPESATPLMDTISKNISEPAPLLQKEASLAKPTSPFATKQEVPFTPDAKIKPEPLQLPAKAESTASVPSGLVKVDSQKSLYALKDMYAATANLPPSKKESIQMGLSKIQKQVMAGEINPEQAKSQLEMVSNEALEGANSKTRQSIISAKGAIYSALGLGGAAAAGTGMMMGGGDGKTPPASTPPASPATPADNKGPAAKGSTSPEAKVQKVVTKEVYNTGDIAGIAKQLYGKADTLSKEDKPVIERKLRELTEAQKNIGQLYKDRSKRTEWAEVAEMFGHALTQLAAGIYGMKNGVDLSGLNLAFTELPNFLLILE